MLARVKEFDGDVDKLLAEYQQDIGIETGQLGGVNLELKDCVDEPRRVSQRVPRQESLRIWLRVQVCLRESLRLWIRVWLRVWIRVCLHAEQKRRAMVLVNQLSVDKRDYERMRVQVAHNSVVLNKSSDAAKLKKVELWQLKKCDMKIKSWKARVIQSGALGTKRECLSQLVARLKHDRDDDAKYDAVYSASPGASPMRRRTECE